MNEERYVINFKDIGAFLYKKVRVFIILFVIGGCLGGLLSFLENRNNTYANELKAQETRLSSNELKNAKGAVTVYKSILKQKNNYNKILHTSLVKDVSVNKYKKVKLLYSISKNNDSDAIAYAFKQLYASKTLFTKLSSILDVKVDEAIFNGFVNIENQKNQNNVSIENSSDVLSITVYARNDSEALKLKNIFKEETSNNAKKLSKSFGSFNLNLIDDSITSLGQTDVYNIESYFNEKLDQLKAETDKLLNSLNDQEKEYVNFVVESDGQIKKAVFKKYCINILGVGLLLPFLYLLMLLFKYFHSHVLHNEEEITDRFNIPTVISVDTASPYARENLKKEVQFAATKTKCIFVSTLTDESTVTDVLEDQVVFNYLPKSDSDFMALKDIENVYMIEKVHFSNIDNIRELVYYYRSKGICIKGVFILK